MKYFDVTQFKIDNLSRDLSQFLDFAIDNYETIDEARKTWKTEGKPNNVYTSLGVARQYILTKGGEYQFEYKYNKDSKGTILLLHGVGADENDLFDIKDVFDGYNVFSLRAPFKFKELGNAWCNIDFYKSGEKIYNEIELNKSIGYIKEFKRHIHSLFDIPVENFYLLGFSQGAVLANSTYFSNTKLFSGCVSLSGFIHETTKRMIEYTNDESMDVNLFIGHGSLDEVVPESKDISSQELLNSLKNNPIYTNSIVYKSYKCGHTITHNQLNDVWHWILKK